LINGFVNLYIKIIGIIININMIFGGLFIVIALIAYFSYNNKRPPKGSLGYYRQQWREVANYYNK